MTVYATPEERIAFLEAELVRCEAHGRQITFFLKGHDAPAIALWGPLQVLQAAM